MEWNERPERKGETVINAPPFLMYREARRTRSAPFFVLVWLKTARELRSEKLKRMIDARHVRRLLLGGLWSFLLGDTKLVSFFNADWNIPVYRSTTDAMRPIFCSCLAQNSTRVEK